MSSQKSGDAMELSSVELITQNLRERSQNDGVTPERVIAALKRVGDIWESRLAPDSDWTPPEGSPFPWAQVRISLAGLIPGLKGAGTWLLFAIPSHGRYEGVALPKGRCAALVLSGNTPLMSWSPLCACLLAGYSVFVKMSRDETLWPRLLIESLAEVDASVSARVHLDAWPGEDERTDELCRASDAVIAFGSDTTIAALRHETPQTTPFFGFGHSGSIGLCAQPGVTGQAGDFARDILLFGQGGCLSPQAIFAEQDEDWAASRVANLLADALPRKADSLQIPAVTDAATARAVRTARDMALFDGATVHGDETLRWTVICRRSPVTMIVPTGHGVIEVIPVRPGLRDLPERLGPLRGRLSCIGIAGRQPETLATVLHKEGFSRICRAGEMQSPPLDWPNGRRNLLEELLRIGQTVAERR